MWRVSGVYSGVWSGWGVRSGWEEDHGGTTMFHHSLLEGLNPTSVEPSHT